MDKESEDKVLKVDALGRVKRSREDREAIVDEFERSGMPATRFSELRGINYQTFATWVQRRKRERGEYPESSCSPPEQPPAFALIETNLEPSESSPESGEKERGIEITLSSGAKLTVATEEQAKLAAVLISKLSRCEPC